MKAETLSAEVDAALHELAWTQWSQLGISGAAPADREERVTDPEALLLFTLEVGRTDPRLFDEVLDWLALNEPLISVRRLRSLCADATDSALVAATLDWTAGVRRPKGQGAGAAPGLASNLGALFPTLPMLSDELDPAFARHGFARPLASRSGKSQPPRLTLPINFAFRLRRMLGVGVRAEVIRALLTIRAPRLSGKVIAAEAAFDQRSVREGISQLHEAGVIDVLTRSDERYYSIRSTEWAALLRLESARDLPFHHDWIQTYRALTQITRWLRQPGLDDLSPFVRASQARTLVDALTPDLQYAGVPVGIYDGRGAAFWDSFAEIVGVVIQSARGRHQVVGG